MNTLIVAEYPDEGLVILQDEKGRFAATATSDQIIDLGELTLAESGNVSKAEPRPAEG